MNGSIMRDTYSHDAIQIVSRIIFNRSLLYGVAHDFGQMLAHPPGNVMNAFIIDGFNKLCQMAGFNLCNVHCANIREDVALQAGEDFIGVVSRPEFQATGVPCGGDVLKGACAANGGFLRLAGLGRANTGYQPLMRRIALLAGFCQRNLRIGAEGQTVFLTCKTLAEIP
ncbi:hypothetical protein LRT63_000244 [Salmonella enterica]|nr:hypothetical protein [Salmonella enterica]